MIWLYMVPGGFDVKHVLILGGWRYWSLESTG